MVCNASEETSNRTRSPARMAVQVQGVIASLTIPCFIKTTDFCFQAEATHAEKLAHQLRKVTHQIELTAADATKDTQGLLQQQQEQITMNGQQLAVQVMLCTQ